MDYFLGEMSGSGFPEIRGKEMHHCLKVLRHVKGDIISVTDGKGHLWVGELLDDRRDAESVRIRVIEEKHGFGEDTAELILITAIPEDTDRAEWLLEKAVELGVSRICITRTRRSGFMKVKPVRIENILSSAVKQCGRCRIPEFAVYESLQDVLEALKFPKANKWVGAASAIPAHTLLRPDSEIPWILAAGPEGDFAPEEMEMLENNGFQQISIGRLRLRSETAGLALLAWARSLRG